MKKVNITFNINSLLYNNDEDALELLKKLGKYKTGKSCLYIKRLHDIDLPDPG